MKSELTPSTVDLTEDQDEKEMETTEEGAANQSEEYPKTPKSHVQRTSGGTSNLDKAEHVSSLVLQNAAPQDLTVVELGGEEDSRQRDPQESSDYEMEGGKTFKGERILQIALWQAKWKMRRRRNHLRPGDDLCKVPGQKRG